MTKNFKSYSLTGDTWRCGSELEYVAAVKKGAHVKQEIRHFHLNLFIYNEDSHMNKRNKVLFIMRFSNISVTFKPHNGDNFDSWADIL